MGVPASLDALQRGPVVAALYRDVPWATIVEDLKDARRYPCHSILVLELLNETWGHWWALLRRGPVVELFDSTGRTPDELRARLTPAGAAALGQAGTPLTDALRAAEQGGATLRYNNACAQPDSKDSVTCGWWALSRALAHQLDEYAFLDRIAGSARAAGCRTLDAYMDKWGDAANALLAKGRPALKTLRALHTGGSGMDDDRRPLSTLPAEALEVVDVLRVPPLPGVLEADCRLVGSFTLRAASYPSDIDIDQRVLLDDLVKTRAQAGALLAKLVQGVTKKILAKKGWFFSDVKAGEKDGEGLHWTSDEVLAGKKGSLTLAKACESPTAVLKIDCIAPVLSRYLEASTFIHARVGDKPINYENLGPKAIARALTEDGKDQMKKGKAMKAAKRWLSAARLLGDQNAIDRLAPLLRSGSAQLATAAADLETLNRILEVGGTPDVRLAKEAISLLAFDLSSVSDVPGFSADKFSAEAKAAAEFLQAGDRAAFMAASERLQAYIRALTNAAVGAYLRKN